jgi:dihydrofolate reductase
VRELVVTENITVDGVIDASEGWFAPTGGEDVDSSDIEDAIRQQREAADAILVGRVTFEQLRGYWPNQHDDRTGISDYLNAVSKYVVSGTLADPGWENTTVLGGPVLDEVRALKAQPGKDIVATGSMTLVQALIAAGLVDEYRLFVYPIALGHGQQLFPDVRGLALRLAEARPFRSGVVLLRYRPA